MLGVFLFGDDIMRFVRNKKTTSDEMSKNKQIPELKLEKDVREKDFGYSTNALHRHDVEISLAVGY